MDYDEVERRRRAAAPGTIPNAPSEERARAQTTLPNLDPKKVPDPSAGYTGGYNAQSAANAQPMRVTSPDALAPRALQQRQAAATAPGQYRPSILLPNAVQDASGTWVAGSSAKPSLEEAYQRMKQGKMTRADYEVLFAPGSPYESYRPSVEAPSDQANYTNVTDTGVVNNPNLSTGRDTGVDPRVVDLPGVTSVRRAPNQPLWTGDIQRPINSVSIDGVDFDAGRLPEGAPPGLQAGDTVVAGETNADRDKYRAAIADAAREEAALAGVGAQSERRALRTQAAESASRRGGVRSPANRQIDYLVAQQLAQRQASIKADEARQQLELERELKSKEFAARDRAQQMNLSRQQFEASRPRSFADQLWNKIPDLAAAVATRGASAYLDQSGLFEPDPLRRTSPQPQLGGADALGPRYDENYFARKYRGAF